MPALPSFDALLLALESAAHDSAFGINKPRPTPAQCEANNYKVGRWVWNGLTLCIEQPRGSVRAGASASGKAWRNTMAAHYGYVQGTRGADGDPVDCFIGTSVHSDRVFVVNQAFNGRFDEHKVMLCFQDLDSAKSAYMRSYDRDWQGLQSIVPLSFSQFKWWLSYADLDKALDPQNLPYEPSEETQMKRPFWSSAADPIGRSLDQLIYSIRQDDDGEGLLLDAVTRADILSDPDNERVLVLDAMMTPYAKVDRKMALLQSVMDRVDEGVKTVAMQVTDPFRQRGTVNVAAIYELSDGQTVSVYLHNPDTTPAKLAPGDELISWKWLLNKKDITIVVAPERGQDLNIREVARRIMKLAAKNSAAFKRANTKRAERLEAIEDLKGVIAKLENELDTAKNEYDLAKMQSEEAAAKRPTNGGLDRQEPEAPHKSELVLKALVGEQGWESANSNSVRKYFPGVRLGGETVPDGGRWFYATYFQDAERRRYISLMLGDTELADFDGRDSTPEEMARMVEERAQAEAQKMREKLAPVKPAEPDPIPEPENTTPPAVVEPTGIVNGDGEQINNEAAQKAAEIVRLLVQKHGFSKLDSQQPHAFVVVGKFSRQSVDIGVDRYYPDALEIDGELDLSDAPAYSASAEILADAIAAADFVQAYGERDLNGEVNPTIQNEGSIFYGKSLVYARAAIGIVEAGASLVGVSVHYGDFSNSTSAGLALDGVTGSETIAGITAQLHSGGIIWARADISEEGAVTLLAGVAGAEKLGEPKSAQEVADLLSGVIDQWGKDQAEMKAQLLKASQEKAAQLTEPDEADAVEAEPANALAQVNALRKLVSKETIRSDDPEVIEKLQAKLNYLQAYSTLMRNANKLVRKDDRAGLANMGFSERVIAGLFEKDFAGRIGFADYELKNTNAEARRTALRLEQLAALKQAQAQEQADPPAEPQPSQEPAPDPEPPQINPDRAMLQAIVDGTVDPSSVDLDELEAIYSRNANDAGIQTLFEQAVDKVAGAELAATAGV